MKKALIIVIIFAGLLFGYNEETTSPIRPAEGYTLFGLRASGMGGAHIALADDYTALYYNPARLSYIYRPEVSLGLNFENVANTNTWNSEVTEVSQTWTRLNQLGLLIPVPTSQGGLSFALGFNRFQSYNQTMDFSNGDDISGYEEVSGGMSSFSIGGGVQISEIAALGMVLDIPFGVENYSYLEAVEDSVLIEDRTDWSTEYNGISGKLGIAINPNKHVNLGLLIEFPTYYSANQEATFSSDPYATSPDSTVSYEEYHLTTPFKFGGGISLKFPYVVLAGDIKYADYSQTEYNESWLRYKNPRIKNSYRDVLSYNAGIEGIIPKAGVKLRAGYCHEPLHYTAYPVIEDRNIFTGGVGFLVSKTISLDLAVTYGMHKVEYEEYGWTEEWTKTNIFLGMAYRF